MNATPSLLRPWTGPMGGVPPLDTVDVDALRVSLDAAMEQAEAELEELRSVVTAGTFDDTVLPLDQLADTLELVQGVYDNWSWAHASPELRALRREMEPRLSARRDALYGDTDLYARVRHTADHDRLDPVQARLTQRMLERFEAAGAHLEEATRNRVASINQRLSSLYAEFSDRVMTDEEELITWLDADQLDGLPASWVSSARGAAVAHGHADRWAVRNTRSAVEPFLTLSPHRALREQVWRTFYGRGELREKSLTLPIAKEILALRGERARLLGYRTHAHKVLSRTMAATPEAAMGLLKQVWGPAVSTFKRELAAMSEVAAAEGFTGELQPWDVRYFGEKVRQRDHDLDPNELQQYFQLDRLRDGMFWAAQQCLGWTVTPIEVPKPHPDIETYAVTAEDGSDIGIFHFDPFARAGKRSGAWMSVYRSQRWTDERVPPIVLNTCNFLKPSDDSPALLSPSDAQTLFHEFGHGMHGLASRVRYRHLAGTSVVRDFVEFPSQLNERWLTTPELMERFCTHVETGEGMPAELVARMEAAANASSGFGTLEFLASAVVDMAMHMSEDEVDPAAFEQQVLNEWGLPSQVVMRHRTPQFSHIFSGEGYAAGYYCYLWADTLVADAAEAFEEQGYYNRELARRYHDTVLSIGDTVDAAEAFRTFRGRDPEVTPLLRHRGLISSSDS